MLCGLSNGLSFLAYRVVGYRRAVVMSNLRKCFPHKTERELKRIARLCYRNFADLMLNMMRIRFASQRRVMRTVQWVNAVDISTRYANRNMLMLAGHYSCWEYIGITQLFGKHQTVAAYQPAKGAIERITSEGRARFGAKLSPLNKVFRTLLEHRNKGVLTYTLMVSDQSPGVGSCDHWLTFMGQDTPVFSTPERMAQITESVVHYLRIKELKRFHYQYEIVTITENAAQEPPMEVTKKFFALLEEDILRCPQLWMWTHKRWKHPKTMDNGQ
ncbi:acetyltransferase [Bacteroidia bacterium]|nr:acetyltransferase [Bacteroidia bacterium]